MSFKIEDHIPIPKQEELDEPEVVEEPSRWTPFKPHKGKCQNDKHYPMIGKCERCGDIFPCPSGNCGHFDCANPALAGLDCEGNGTETSEFFDVIDSSSVMVRAEGGTITISEERPEQKEFLDRPVLDQGSEEG